MAIRKLISDTRVILITVSASSLSVFSRPFATDAGRTLTASQVHCPEARRRHPLADPEPVGNRSSGDDPAQTAVAKQKRAASSKERMLAVRPWERLNGKVHDWNRYEAEVIPVIKVMTVPELVHVTGLRATTAGRCGKVRNVASDGLEPPD